MLKLADPATHGTPDRTATLDDPIHGRVQVDVWRDLHVQTAADAPFPLVRIDVERLPRHTKRPKPLWLAWIGGPLPDDLHDLWRWYCRRYLVEHGFRFLKHDPPLIREIQALRRETRDRLLGVLPRAEAGDATRTPEISAGTRT